METSKPTKPKRTKFLRQLFVVAMAIVALVVGTLVVFQIQTNLLMQSSNITAQTVVCYGISRGWFVAAGILFVVAAAVVLIEIIQNLLQLTTPPAPTSVE